MEIKKIQIPSRRKVTFSKRRTGLLKKARELSVLCGVEVALIIFSESGRLHEFASSEMDAILRKYTMLCQTPKNTSLSYKEIINQGVMASSSSNETPCVGCKTLTEILHQYQDEAIDLRVEVKRFQPEYNKMLEFSHSFLEKRKRESEPPPEIPLAPRPKKTRTVVDPEVIELKRQVASMREEMDKRNAEIARLKSELHDQKELVGCLKRDMNDAIGCLARRLR